MSRLILLLIRAYQRFVSPLFPNSCRFLPTCSEYAAQAVIRHGVFRGSALAFCRIIRCHPLCKGGYDPVPPLAVPAPRSRDASPRNESGLVNGS